MRYGDPEGAMRRWREGWKELQENLPDEVDTFEGAQEAFGKAFPNVQNWMWDVLNTGRGLATKNPDRVAPAVDFAEEFLAGFGGESGELRGAIQAELAYFIGRAGRIEAAEEICRRLIDEQPEQARGYCTLADVYLGAEPPELSRALEILEEAVEYPVKDPEDWDLTRRIDQVRRDLRMKEARESEHFVEWKTFWDDFEKAELDEKLAPHPDLAVGFADALRNQG
ncbi:MAG: tetratricopeptide repeat protein, partial [Persicimonas sp.]